MSKTRGDKLVITEDSEDDYEREEYGSDQENDDDVDQPASDPNETVAFAAPQKKRKLIKKLTKKEQGLKRSMKDYRIRIAMFKPDITSDRERERNFKRIATKGVVQLFNAVSDRQRTMSDAVKDKMTARDRKEARERFDGKNFDIDKFENYGYGAKKEVKGEGEAEEEMEINEDEIDNNNYSDED